MIRTHMKRTIIPMKWIANVNTALPLSFKKAEIYMAMEYDIVVTNNLTLNMYSEVNLDLSPTQEDGDWSPTFIPALLGLLFLGGLYPRVKKIFRLVALAKMTPPHLWIWVNAPDLNADAVWFHTTTSDHHLRFISYFFVPPAANKD